MSQQELSLDYDYYDTDECSFEDVKKASNQLTTATEEQFKVIKNEKWFTRVFDMITFSKKKEKRVATQIQNLAQAQELLIEILIRLSNRDTRIADLVTESFDKIEKLSKNDVLLAKRINQLEKRSILGISQDTDIEDLSQTEREILGGLFFHLMQQFPVATENQRRYAHSVLNYVDVEAQEIHINNAIHSVKNIDKKKKLLTCCVEYSFLHTLNFDFNDEIESFIDIFDFGNQSIKDIKSNIQLLYNLRGVDGFIDKYGSYDDFTESFFVEVNEEVNEKEVELQDLNIDTLIHIPKGETKTFKNKIVHINFFINCEGDLEFENCSIHYNQTNTHNEIMLEKESQIHFTDSSIHCHGFQNDYLIKTTENNNVTFKNTTFQDCTNFLQLDRGSHVEIFQCRLYDPSMDFVSNISASSTNSKSGIIIENSFIYFNVPTKFNKELTSEFSFFDIFHSYNDYATVKDCVIQAENDYSYNNLDSIFHFKNATFDNCNFINVNQCISFDGSYVINQCTFNRCKTVIKNRFGSTGEITNSLFISCDDVISSLRTSNINNCIFDKCQMVMDYIDNANITNSLFKSCENIFMGDNLQIENNQFVECKNQLVEGEKIHIKFCEFYNITNDKDVDFEMKNYSTTSEESLLMNESNVTAAFSFVSHGRNQPVNTIEKCIFNGADLQMGCLVKGKYFKGISDFKVIIKDCNFKNIETNWEHAKVIQEKSYYFGLFNKIRIIKPVKIENCIGLDKVNLENSYAEDVKIKLKSSNEVQIGASLLK